MKEIIKFFDKLEDKVRGSLSRWPILYTLIGGIAIVLFWRGVWMTADQFSFLTGPVSIVVSVGILLITGLFVSFFIGEQIIMSGLKGEKKIFEKTKEEVQQGSDALINIQLDLKSIANRLDKIEDKLKR